MFFFVCKNLSTSIYSRQRDAEKIFADAESENMTGTGYAWIVTEQVNRLLDR